MIIEVVGKEIEKIKGDFESYLNGLNMVGEISYSQYSELYDEGTKQIQKAYELGNKANEWHYVKDGNPEELQDVLCFVIHNEQRFVLQGFLRDGRWVLSPLGTYLNNEDVIAWKEIVLPELKESR